MHTCMHKHIHTHTHTHTERERERERGTQRHTETHMCMCTHACVQADSHLLQQKILEGLKDEKHFFASIKVCTRTHSPLLAHLFTFLLLTYTLPQCSLTQAHSLTHIHSHSLFSAQSFLGYPPGHIHIKVTDAFVPKRTHPLEIVVVGGYIYILTR